MLAAAAASSSGFVLAPAFVDADGNVTREYGSLAAMQRDALRWTLPRDVAAPMNPGMGVRFGALSTVDKCVVEGLLSSWR